MFTIAGLTSRTDLPRRAIQFWADKGVLEPMPAEDDAPRMYSKRELQICRLLRSLYSIGAPIKTLKMFSGFVRIVLDGLEIQREGDIEVVDAALSGAPAWFVVGFGDMSEDSIQPASFARYRGDAGWPSVYAFTTNPREIGTMCAEISSQSPWKHIVVFNLTDALFYKPKSARMSGE